MSVATLPSPTEVTIAFGKRVIVRAETVRVIGKIEGDQPRYRQAAAARDQGRLVRHEIERRSDGHGWPGMPVSLTLAPAKSDAFHPGPDLFEADGDVLTRLRRIPLDVPEIGIVIGVTRRQEGTQRGDNDEAHLAGPGRTVVLYEVALPPTSSPKARITLAHEVDLEPIAGRRD